MSNGRDARSERKRRSILTAARRRFVTEGYASTGMELIAKDAAVSTATLYAYFPGKADLFQAMVEDALSDFTTQMRSLSEADGDAMARLRAFAEAYARFHSNPLPRAVFRLIAAERKRFERTAQAFYDRAQTEFGAALMGLLTRLRDEGRIWFEHPAHAAGQLLGMIEHPTLVIPMLAGDHVQVRRTPEAIAAEAVETFLARYATRTASAEAA